MTQSLCWSYFCRVRKKWSRLGCKHGWIIFLIAIFSIYSHLQLFERFHLHLKVVVGGREQLNRNDNVSIDSYAKRDNIWIHIESRPEDNKVKEPSGPREEVYGDETGPKNPDTDEMREFHTSITNNSEVRLVRKTESVSVKKSDGPPSPEDEVATKPSSEDYIVPGWPPDVSRNVSYYVDLESKNTSIMRPKLGPIMAKGRMAFSVIIAAQSAPRNAAERREVRSTWGENCNAETWCRIIFVVGNPHNETLQALLQDEQDMYQDILQEDFVDSYNNLTLKSVMTLKYYANLRKEKLLLLKTDDDSYVHIAGLKSLIDSLFEIPIRPVLTGYLQKGIKKYHYLPLVHRPGLLQTSTLQIHKEWERWLVPTYMYPNQFFPQFLSGSGYIMSLRVAECLLQKSKEVPLLHLEDVFLTGLCAEVCNINRKHHTGFKPRGLDKKKIKLYKYDVVIHRTTGMMDLIRRLEPATEVPFSSSKKHSSKQQSQVAKNPAESTNKNAIP